jgi:hypothetical protein
LHGCNEMNGIGIDRLSVHGTDLSEAQGRELALQIAAGLGAAGTLPAAGDIPSLRVQVAAEPHASLSETAQRIVGEILQQLERAA